MRGEGLKQLDGCFRHFPRQPAAHHEGTDDPFGAKERDGQHGAEARAQHRHVNPRCIVLKDVGNLHGPASPWPGRRWLSFPSGSVQR